MAYVPPPVLCRAIDNIWYPLLFLAFCLQLKGRRSLVSLSPSKTSIHHQLSVPLVFSWSKHTGILGCCAWQHHLLGLRVAALFQDLCPGTAFYSVVCRAPVPSEGWHGGGVLIRGFRDGFYHSSYFDQVPGACNMLVPSSGQDTVPFHGTAAPSLCLLYQEPLCSLFLMVEIAHAALCPWKCHPPSLLGATPYPESSWLSFSGAEEKIDQYTLFLQTKPLHLSKAITSLWTQKS